ncbi:MAG: HAD-IA family hydrolase [Propionibacteriaceae bacterium]
MIVPVFDLGGVLAKPANLLDTIGAELSVSGRDMEGPYWAHRKPYDEGSSPLSYWQDVAASCDTAVDEETARRLAVLDMEQWVQIRPRALSTLMELQQAGHEVYMLSNAPAMLDRVLRQTSWASVLTGWIISGVQGVAKPDLGIYQGLERLVGRTGVDYAFIDDRPNNVQGALDAGWIAHQWTSDEDTRAWLVELGLLT